MLVRAVPLLAAGRAPAPLVEAFAEDLCELGEAVSAERLVDHVQATVACHSAVRIGTPLGGTAARELLAEVATVDFHASCPHGRPVARTLTRSAVERLFGR